MVRLKRALQDGPRTEWLAKAFSFPWEAIAGLLAALAALVLPFFTDLSDTRLLQIAVALIAILFIRVLRSERSTKGIHEELSNLHQGQADLVDKSDLESHHLATKLRQIEASLDDALDQRKWNEIREDIDNLSRGRVIIRDRKAVFEYKARGLRELTDHEHFLSTVVPSDLEDRAYTYPGFKKYCKAICEVASRRPGSVRRLYVFENREQLRVSEHREHVQSMIEGGVDVWYLIVTELGRADSRRRVQGTDYAIFGERFYAHLDVEREYSVFDRSRERTKRAIEEVEGFLAMAKKWPPPIDTP